MKKTGGQKVPGKSTLHYRLMLAKSALALPPRREHKIANETRESAELQRTVLNKNFRDAVCPAEFYTSRTKQFDASLEIDRDQIGNSL